MATQGRLHEAPVKLGLTHLLFDDEPRLTSSQHLFCQRDRRLRRVTTRSKESNFKSSTEPTVHSPHNSEVQITFRFTLSVEFFFVMTRWQTDLQHGSTRASWSTLTATADSEYCVKTGKPARLIAWFHSYYKWNQAISLDGLGVFTQYSESAVVENSVADPRFNAVDAMCCQAHQNLH